MDRTRAKFFESAANTAPRPTPTAVGGPTDISVLQVQLGDARRALWQGDFGTAERSVELVLHGLNARWSASGDPVTDLRTVEASAHTVLGQILTEGGGPAEAKVALHRAVDGFRLILGQGSDRPQVYADFGAALYLLGMDEEAQQALRRAAALGDRSPYSLRLRAEILLHQGGAEESKELLESANTAAPGDVDILALLGRAERQLGDTRAAQSQLRQAATAARKNGDLRRASLLFDEAVELAPEDPDLHCARGDVLLRLGEPIETVLAAFDRALALAPGHRRAKIGKADALRVAGDFKAALALLDDVLSGPDRPADALALKGDVLRLLERYDEALAALDLAVDQDTATAWIIGTRGQVRHALDQLPEAERDLARAVTTDPGLVWAWAELAATRYGLGDGSGAMEAAQRALDLDDTVPLALAVQAHRYLDTGSYGDAITSLERLRGLAPELGWVWTGLAEAYHRTGNGDQAHHLADEAIMLGVAEPALQLLHAELLMAERPDGRPDRVHEDLEAYLVSHPENPAGLRRAGQVYWELGEYDRAAAAFAESLLHDDRPDVRRDKARAEFAGKRYEEVLRTLDELPTAILTKEDLWRRGRSAREQGDLKQASQSFKLALDVDREYLPAMNELVEVNLLLGKVDRARKYATMALDQAGDDVASLVSAADVELATFGHEQALEHLDKALTLAPDDPDVLVTYAVALSDTGEFAKVVRMLERREKRVASPAALLGFALENMAIGALSGAPPRLTPAARKLVERARTVYQGGLADRDEDFFLRQGLADTTYTLDGRAAARPEYTAIIDAMERSARYDGDQLGVLGWCYSRIGQYDEAIRTYVSALSADHSAETLYIEFDLALATLASGRTEIGIKEYERAWKLNKRVPKVRWRGLLQVARNDVMQTLLGGGFGDRTAPVQIIGQFDKLLRELG